MDDQRQVDWLNENFEALEAEVNKLTQLWGWGAAILVILIAGLALYVFRAIAALEARLPPSLTHDHNQKPYTLRGRQVVVLFVFILVNAVVVVWFFALRSP